VSVETRFLSRWLEQAKRGDDDAFRRMVEATRNTLFWTIRRMVGREAIAEEILQDAYMAIWGTSERVENPEAWLRRTVIRRSIDHLRREETKREHLDFDEVAFSLPGSDDPAKQLGTLEAEARLQRALDSLPSKMRAAILLRMEGYEYTEVAEMLAVTESTVRNHVFQARQRLGPWLKGEGK
jgi:RNA polymerase sigma-70 factor, ECF subfamily